MSDLEEETGETNPPTYTLKLDRDTCSDQLKVHIENIQELRRNVDDGKYGLDTARALREQWSTESNQLLREIFKEVEVSSDFTQAARRLKSQQENWGPIHPTSEEQQGAFQSVCRGLIGKLDYAIWLLEAAEAEEESIVEVGSRHPAMIRFPTPDGARWSQVTMRFKDGQTLLIKVLGKRGTYTYAEMGMTSRKSGSPTLQWELLEQFALEHGTISWDSTFADRKLMKRRGRLSETLQKFFGIDGSPIQWDQKTKAWRTRFQIESR